MWGGCRLKTVVWSLESGAGLRSLGFARDDREDCRLKSVVSSQGVVHEAFPSQRKEWLGNRILKAGVENYPGNW